jgi:hypothetical protein
VFTPWNIGRCGSLAASNILVVIGQGARVGRAVALGAIASLAFGSLGTSVGGVVWPTRACGAGPR